MKCALARGGLVAWTASGGRVSRMARFQQTPRRLAMGDEAFVQDEAGLGLDRAGASAPDPGTAALLRLGGGGGYRVAGGLPGMERCVPGRLRYFRSRDPAER